MLHVHVRSEDDVVASEPGDPENWIQLRTSFPRHILEHFKDAAPVPPRMMHVTFASGEFDAESGAELVVDALDTLRIGARANAEYDKDDAAVVDDHVRVWATSTGHSPTAHRHAKPARILSSADLLKLRDKFLATTDEPGPPATAQLGPERQSEEVTNANRDGGGGASPSVSKFHAELDDMRRVFSVRNLDTDVGIVSQMSPAIRRRVDMIESELCQGQFGPLVHVEPDAKVYKKSLVDESGSLLKAVKIKPVTLEDADGNLCYRHNSVAVVGCSNGSRLTEEVLRTKKVGSNFEEYAHLKNTKKSKPFASGFVCWCRQEYKHKVPTTLAPGSMNVDSSFDYLLNTNLLDSNDNKADSYMDEEGRSVRKAKRMQRGTKTGSDGQTEDCWKSWVVKETRDPLDGGLLLSNKQRETRMSPDLVHHVLHNVAKSVVEEGPHRVTTVTILVVHRVEPGSFGEHINNRSSLQPATTAGLCEGDKSLKDLRNLLDAMDSEDEVMEDDDDDDERDQILAEIPHGPPSALVAADVKPRAGILVNGGRDSGGMAFAEETKSSSSSKSSPKCIQEVSCVPPASTQRQRKSSKGQTRITINVECCPPDRSTSGASSTRSRSRKLDRTTSQKMLSETRAISGDEEQFGEECPPDEFDEMLDKIPSPVVDDDDILTLKRKKLNEELRQKWTNTVTKISLGELFLSMPRTTKTSLNAAHSELAQAKVAAMALRFNYGVQEAEQGECPPWCSRRRN